MTFRQAVKIAQNNEEFCKHYNNVTEAYRNNTASSCLIFAIDGQCFYYGFDGVELQQGKHSAKRSQALINRDEALIR